MPIDPSFQAVIIFALPKPLSFMNLSSNRFVKNTT